MKHTTARQQEIGDVFTLDGGRATSGHTNQTPKVAPAKPSEQGAPLPGMVKPTKHTPGPYHAQEVKARAGQTMEVQVFAIGNGTVIASCYGMNRIANATLFSAAPDLFNALERIVRDLEYTWGGEQQIPPMERAYYSQAKAALLKAQGGATV